MESLSRVGTVANENIKKLLDSCLESKGHRGDAILINGEWGVGKTWFIKKYIKDRSRRSNEENNNVGKDFIYISLYGIKTIPEIANQFLESLLSFSSSGKSKSRVRFVGGVTSGVLHFFTSFIGINFGPLVKIIPKIAEEFSGVKTVIFDDLERCEVPPNELLGYINNFLEHKEKNVIILSNEDKMDDKNKSTYLEIKEKVIGRTLTIASDFDLAFESFLENVNDDCTKKIIKKNENKIKEVYNIIGYQNLRILRRFFKEFSIFYKQLPQDKKEHDDMVGEIIETLMVFLFEIQKGSMDVDDIIDIGKKFEEANKGQDKENSCLGNIVGKYKVDRFFDLCPDDRCWHSFFKKGVIDSRDLEESINNSKYFFNEEKKDEWVKLWHHAVMDKEEEFRKELKNLKDKLKDHKYTRPEIILHIACGWRINSQAEQGV